MYKIMIKTKYNTITLEIDNLQDTSLQEILEQPYIEEVRIENIQEPILKLKK